MLQRNTQLSRVVALVAVGVVTVRDSHSASSHRAAHLVRHYRDVNCESVCLEVVVQVFKAQPVVGVASRGSRGATRQRHGHSLTPHCTRPPVKQHRAYTQHSGNKQGSHRGNAVSTSATVRVRWCCECRACHNVQTGSMVHRAVP